MKRYHITVGAKTTADGTVMTGYEFWTIDGQPIAREGDEVACPACDSTGVIVCDGPHLVDLMQGRPTALDGDLCHCKCDPPPRLIANQTLQCQEFKDLAPDPRFTPPSTPFTTQQPATGPRSSNFTSTPSRPTPTFTERPERVCENLWISYQQQAESIVAPGGQLIADPKARNRAINAAYARLWLQDPRFQWAGLAAFASKQVGCGLLHAADSIDRIQAEYDAEQQLQQSARSGFYGLLEPSERERQARLQTFRQAQRDYEHALRNNPLPGIDFRPEGELSYAQQLYQHVYKMLAMGNTTLFLDVYPLHVFYQERGMSALEACLPSRKNIYGNVQNPVLWPVAQERLEFGTNYEEILQAFQAIEIGSIARSVELLAEHEQVNILQPAMYSDRTLVALLRGNHLSHVTNFPSGVAQAIELTLASQCQRMDDGRTIDFGRHLLADLSDIQQRMPFVLRAAAQFESLLRSNHRNQIEQAIQDIAAGWGVR
ncbi:hypothetical protein PspS04_22970 [Pseudomonas sp. S04]|uniref:PAAR domain-containing protein n=1 Tax=unclassified Pseudomonas TaxID=196821 RepID=UPI00131FC566|nr:MULTISPECIES: PAAR domain-containing protein [unclassified Pseudomonas]QHD03046.1 hypothetical protein PspS04_22970 [Pseudomonas sp. S04]QHF35531.1 hypothetical protein PspS19_22980 [Pseudomonas sp. S19]